MAKVKRSLIGKEAHGVLAKNLLLRTHGKQIIIGRLTSSTNPRTPAQIAHRSIFQGGIQYWHTLTDEEKAAYTALNPKVGYNPAYLNFMGTWLMGTVPDHHEDHELGGSGQISLAGLTGLLADQQVSFRLRTGLDADKPAAGNTEGDVWWATDTDKLYLWDGAAWAEVGAGAAGATLTIAQTEVYNGNSPNAWTDLDLSGVVGANQALVLIKIRCPTNLYGAIRTNGDADEFYSTMVGANAGGMANCRFLDAIHIVLMVATDSNGRIEWKLSGVAAGTTIDVMAYLK